MSQMTPIDWAKRPLQKYADFTGRASRSEFWWYTLAVVVLSLVVSIVEGLVGLTGTVGPYGPISLLLMLALLAPGLAVTARRLHDTNRSGWWMLIVVIPYAIMAIAAVMALSSGSMGAVGILGLVSIVALVGAVALLVFMVLPGTPGDNRYGPHPLGGTGGVAAA